MLSGPFYAPFWRRVGNHGDNPITLQDKNKADQDLWSPTQAKTRLEWATQPYVGFTGCGKLFFLKGTGFSPYI